MFGIQSVQLFSELLKFVVGARLKGNEDVKEAGIFDKDVKGISNRHHNGHGHGSNVSKLK